MDGDPSGRGAETKIFNSLEDRIPRKRFRLPFESPPVDPGNMSMERVEVLQKLLAKW
jgi:hypothetical protein